jgi:hypothetical protein
VNRRPGPPSRASMAAAARRRAAPRWPLIFAVVVFAGVALFWAAVLFVLVHFIAKAW